MLVALAKLGNPEVIGQFALGLAMLWTEYKHTPHSLRLLQTTVLSGNRHPTYVRVQRPSGTSYTHHGGARPIDDKKPSHKYLNKVIVHPSYTKPS